jgi:hypothetical protein
MSWLMTLIAHSHLPGCTSSFLAPLPLPLPYPHPPPLPAPPHRHLVVPLLPVLLLWLFAMSPCCLRYSVDIYGCVIAICIIAHHLGGSVVVSVVVHHLRCCPSSMSWRCCPFLALRHRCVHRHLSLALSFELSSVVSIVVRCLHSVLIVCIVICVVVSVACPLCHCQLRYWRLCCWGVGESLLCPVYLCGGGRWCDIPMTGQTMARTYSNKQRNPSK